MEITVGVEGRQMTPSMMRSLTLWEQVCAPRMAGIRLISN